MNPKIKNVTSKWFLSLNIYWFWSKNIFFLASLGGKFDQAHKFLCKHIYTFWCAAIKFVYKNNNIKIEFSYLERGRNMEPSMNTEPERRMYQLVASSPVLKAVVLWFITCNKMRDFLSLPPPFLFWTINFFFFFFCLEKRNFFTFENNWKFANNSTKNFFLKLFHSFFFVLK